MRCQSTLSFEALMSGVGLTLSFHDAHKLSRYFSLWRPSLSFPLSFRSPPFFFVFYQLTLSDRKETVIMDIIRRRRKLRLSGHSLSHAGWPTDRDSAAWISRRQTTQRKTVEEVDWQHHGLDCHCHCVKLFGCRNTVLHAARLYLAPTVSTNEQVVVVVVVVVANDVMDADISVSMSTSPITFY